MPGFRGLLLAGGALGLATVSDSFVFLTLQRQIGFSAAYFPLLYAGVAACHGMLAIPIGRTADRFGRWRTFLAGHAVLLLVYLVLVGPGPGLPRLFLALVLFGSYYAATDGVLAAMASAVLPPAPVRKRSGGAVHGDQRRAAARIRGVRRDLDVDGAEQRDRRVCRQPRAGHRGRSSCPAAGGRSARPPRALKGPSHADRSPRTVASLMFAAFCGVFLAIAAVYVLRGRVYVLRTAVPATNAPAEAPVVADSLTVLGDRPGFLFSSTAFDRTNGYLGVESLGGSGTARYETTLRCERVHFARGVGVCLTGERKAITTFAASFFGPDFKVRHTVQLVGTPSRARMSPDGRRAAVTVFVSGDSYNAAGFSTRTTLIDAQTGAVIADLETFAVTRDGEAASSRSTSTTGG